MGTRGTFPEGGGGDSPATPGGYGEAAEMDAPPTLAPGTRLGKYEVVRLLGAGGMGAVYEAAHVEIGKRVALKLLSPAVAAVRGARARFLREAQLASRVRHPNIVDVTDMGTEGPHTFIVMELLSGEDLAARVGRTGRLSVSDLVDIMLPVCSAVSAAHKAGITHRDLKPQNIFLSARPHFTEPKVLDFGISKGEDDPTAGGAALTGTGAMIGTPFYLAPEQIVDNRTAGPASDQYALGVILYECLTGVRPFQGENLYVLFQRIVAGAAPRPREHNPHLPADVEQIVVRAMSVNPAARFASVAELGRALLAFASPRARTLWQDAFSVGTHPGTHAVTTPLPPGGSGVKAVLSGSFMLPAPSEPVVSLRPRRGGRMVLLVVAVAVAAVGAAALLGMRSRESTLPQLTDDAPGGSAESSKSTGSPGSADPTETATEDSLPIETTPSAGAAKATTGAAPGATAGEGTGALVPSSGSPSAAVRDGEDTGGGLARDRRDGAGSQRGATPETVGRGSGGSANRRDAPGSRGGPRSRTREPVRPVARSGRPSGGSANPTVSGTPTTAPPPPQQQTPARTKSPEDRRAANPNGAPVLD